MIKLTSLVLALSVMFAGAVIAAETGAICGEVCDSVTGEPLPYSIVYIEGTTMGAQADDHGQFCIKNVPAGCCRLAASSPLYTTLYVVGVRVAVDSSTTVDFVLGPAPVDCDWIITTTPRDILKVSESSKIESVTSETIKVLPAATIYELLRKRGGVVYR